MGNKPVKLNEIYDVEIEGFSHQGEGVGRINNFAVFIPGTIPGEKVSVKIKEIKKNFGRGEIKKIILPSPFRTEPRCQWADICGGCQLQHISYKKQLELKRMLVKDSLRKIGKIEVEVLPVIGMDNPWHYRNKGHFHVEKKEGKIYLGFYQQGTYDFVPAKDSFLFSSNVNKLVKFLEDQLTLLKIDIYNRKTAQGYLRNVLIRESKENNEIMIVFVTTSGKWQLKGLIEKIKKEFPQVVSIYQNINKNRSSVVLGKEFKLFWGKPYIKDKIGSLKFNISPQSFFQVNNQQAKVLYEKALEYAELSGKETVIDAYCGTGTISLFLARKAKKVIGIEVIKEAVSDAEKNAKLNNIENAEFIVGKVEKWLPRWVKEGGKADVIVVDPPRKGCATETLEAIKEVKPERVVYVSCNPSTLARDLNYLVENGYKVEKVQPVDMFPQTGHVECVVLIKRAESHMG